MLLLAQGKPNKMICRDLRLSEGTVKVHVSAILKALNVHSRSQVIVELARRGISVDTPARAQLARLLLRLRSVGVTSPAALAPALLARARADQVAQLYAGWHRTSLSMLLGAALLCFVLWGQAAPALDRRLGRADRRQPGMARRARARVAARQRPGIDATRRWGRYWCAGSTVAGALWGLASLVMFPPSPPHQALLIVCIFGVVLGGLNLTAVYRPCVLRLRAARAGAAHRARRAGRRPGAPGTRRW